MNCPKCRASYCWLCQGDWSKHGGSTGGYYACNIFTDQIKNDKNAKNAQIMIENAKNEMLKYQFYFERWQNHQRSKEICIRQKKKLEKKSRELNQAKKYPSKDLEFFEICADQIILCRQVLKWSYVVGYFSMNYLSTTEIELFKFWQTQLEQQCERTHQLLESDLSPYLDPKTADRTPFFQFKDKMVSHMAQLKDQYEKFSSAIILSE